MFTTGFAKENNKCVFWFGAVTAAIKQDFGINSLKRFNGVKWPSHLNR